MRPWPQEAELHSLIAQHIAFQLPRVWPGLDSHRSLTHLLESVRVLEGELVDVVPLEHGHGGGCDLLGARRLYAAVTISRRDLKDKMLIT